MKTWTFRGTRLDNDEWIEGFYYINSALRPIMAVLPDEIGRSRWHEVDPATVGQYTGLTDMQGVKIFEGDIVEMAEEYGKIEYSETEAMFLVVFDGWLTDFDHYFGTDFEVSGNIHDNPELLDKEAGK